MFRPSCAQRSAPTGARLLKAEGPKQCRISTTARQAELFPLIRRKLTKGLVGYKHFTCAAEAIRFAVEELPPDLLRWRLSRSR